MGVAIEVFSILGIDKLPNLLLVVFFLCPISQYLLWFVFFAPQLGVQFRSVNPTQPDTQLESDLMLGWIWINIFIIRIEIELSFYN